VRRGGKSLGEGAFDKIIRQGDTEEGALKANGRAGKKESAVGGVKHSRRMKAKKASGWNVNVDWGPMGVENAPSY